MYFVLCVASMLGYAVQGTLMAGLYRRFDPQGCIAVRGMCLSVAMLPLLLLVPAEAFHRMPEHLPGIALAGLMASLGGWSSAKAYRYLPVGVTTAFMSMFNTVLIGGLGALFFHEYLAWSQVGVILLILACVALLGMSKSPVSMGLVGHPRRGLLFCLVFAVFVSGSFIILSNTSRTLHPLLTGYLWETLIGLCAMVMTLVRWMMKHSMPIRLTRRDLLLFFLYSSPTAVGTGAFMLAVTMGPVAIVSAVGSSMIMVNTLMARLIFKEKITSWQWMLLALSCLCVITLNLVS